MKQIEGFLALWAETFQPLKGKHHRGKRHRAMIMVNLLRGEAP